MHNTTLIGMPGCGKSTLGKLLASRLDYEFVDCDAIIESSGVKLQEIIDKKGEEEFLRMEEAALLSLSGNGKISSPGGSCVLSPNAMEYLRRISFLVFIDVPFAVLEKRLAPGNIDKRGIIGLNEKTLKKLFDFRRPLYLKYAHLVVNSDERTIQASLDIVFNRIVTYSKKLSYSDSTNILLLKEYENVL